MLVAQNLHKVYVDGKNSLEVLKGIELKIEKGQIIAIVGPSGAGKSTLLHLLGGLDHPTDGRVIFEGTDLEKLSDKELSQFRNKRAGFVFQFYHLLPEFSVLENVLLPALIRKNGDVCLLRQKAQDILGEMGLKARFNHRPNQLSGGEQQRVAVARALINEPDLLLCDEPTGNLDSENGKSVLTLLERLNKRNNVTIVLVTHNEELARIAQKKIHLKDGVIVN